MRRSQTERAYQTDWNDFAAWCGRRGFVALPGTPDTVALYVASLDEQGRKLATIRRRLAAIAAVHRAAGHTSPTGHAVVHGAVATVERIQALEPVSKTPIFPDDLRRMIRRRLPGSPASLRDRSLLLLGYAGALRRTELVGLDIGDIAVEPDGLRMTVAAHATETPGLPYALELTAEAETDLCPVRATRAWVQQLAGQGMSRGPLFRPINRHGQISDQRLSDRAVALIVKRAAAAAGLDPAQYAGHSLRSGRRRHGPGMN